MMKQLKEFYWCRVRLYCMTCMTKQLKEVYWCRVRLYCNEAIEGVLLVYSAFANPVMKHMNEDHTDALKDYVRYFLALRP